MAEDSKLNPTSNSVFDPNRELGGENDPLTHSASPVSELANDRGIVVQTQDLRKVYRTGFWMNQTVVSLKGCSVTVHRGETFGLLGPNGAGKTTLLKLLLGIARPTAGQGQLLGKPLGDRAVRQRVGYLPENSYFYEYLTGWELLKLTARLFQLPSAQVRQRIPQLLELVGLSQTAARKKQLRQYSKGMLQRVGMAQALINDPEVVFLDEPMSGLDPLGRYQIREMIRLLKSQGKTIFFNSHVLSDVEQICDRVAILAQGELLCSGSLNELLGNTDQYRVQVHGGNPEVLKQWILGLEMQEGCWQGILKGNLQEFLGSLDLMGARLESLKTARPSLEEFFVNTLRDQGIVTSG